MSDGPDKPQIAHDARLSTEAMQSTKIPAWIGNWRMTEVTSPDRPVDNAWRKTLAFRILVIAVVVTLHGIAVVDRSLASEIAAGLSWTAIAALPFTAKAPPTPRQSALE